MYDYKEQIRNFIKLNFLPSTPEESNFKVSSNELLGYLFDIFPFECISDYELNEILVELGYERYTYVDTKKLLVFGWCMYSKVLDYKV